jgi:ankyrin repeat protein
VGANLPEQWADSLHISTGPLLLTLISMVSLSLLNYAVKLLPSGLEPTQRKKNPEAIRVLLNAIERGNPSYVKSVLSMEFDVNDAGEGHLTPLMRAAQKGDTALVDLLLRSGADPAFGTSLGRPADLALAAGHTELATRLSDQIAAQTKAAATTAEPEPATIG